MCSEPINHTDRETGEVITFACRTCNQCIAARRSGWIDRGMAERACHTHSLCVTLTYNTETEENRDARSMFQYADVMAFSGRAARPPTGQKEKSGTLSPTCASSAQASKASGATTIAIGIWFCIPTSTFAASANLRGSSAAQRVVTYPEDRKHMMSNRKDKRRLDWSLWAVDKKPKGFVSLGEADLAGMHYVLSYCLKDQFASEKAEGTMREAKSEAFATGLFRMSKRPAIGEEYLVRKMEDLLAKGAVLPSLMIPVPDVDYKWWPTGSMREKALWHLSAINRRIKWATGADAPQWSSLLASVSENEKELEILDGQETEKSRIEREKGAALVARLENIREHHYETVFRNQWFVSCQRCLRLPERFWAWQETGRLVYDKKTNRYAYVSHAGREGLTHREVINRGGEQIACECCGRRRELVGIGEEGQRARHKARVEARYGSSEMPPG